VQVKAQLGLAESVCLTLVASEPRHGWSIVKTLAPDGEIGRVWSLSRPLTYRALDALAAAEMIEPRGSETGAGPPRTIWRATPKGRRASRAWLRRPVAHLRDMRTESWRDRGNPSGGVKNGNYSVISTRVKKCQRVPERNVLFPESAVARNVRTVTMRNNPRARRRHLGRDSPPSHRLLRARPPACTARESARAAARPRA